MKRTLWAIALFAGLVVAAHAEDWTGKLIDVTCHEQKEQEKTVSCAANGATTVFALNVGGTIYKLDAAGNVKAAAALKYRASPAPGAAGSQTGVMATISGTEAGGMILVDSIGLQ